MTAGGSLVAEPLGNWPFTYRTGHQNQGPEPVRWSAARIAQVLNGLPIYDERIPLDNVVEVPDLLRAFVRSHTHRVEFGKNSLRRQ